MKKEPRKLTRKEAEFLADYFHNIEDMPDYDGYLGNYTLPLEVMKIYIKKYSKERHWEEDTSLAGEEFNLSERMSDWTPSQTQNVKEFIMLLKEEGEFVEVDNRVWISLEKIDKLAGDKLRTTEE